MLPKEKALHHFHKFLNRLEDKEDLITAYTKPKVTVYKDEVVFTAQGLDTSNPEDPWVLYLVWKRGTNNLFYYRQYKGYQSDQLGVKAKGDESLAVLLTKMLKKNSTVSIRPVIRPLFRWQILIPKMDLTQNVIGVKVS